MPDIEVLISMIEWRLIDGEMWTKKVKHQISTEEYATYAHARILMTRLINRGNYDFTEEEYSAINKVVGDVLWK